MITSTYHCARLPTGSFTRAVSFASVVLFASCGSPFESWGERAGFGRVQGTVEYADGRAVADAEILITRCGDPIGGLGGEGRTNDDGVYDVRVLLPPVGIYRMPEGLTVGCTVVVNRGAAEAPVDVPFSRLERDVTPVTVDVEVDRP
jgi:hypothetical protein